MAVPAVVAGNPALASFANSYFVPLAAYKTGSAQTLTSNTTMQNDTQLVVTLDVNAVYSLLLSLIFDGAVSTGLAAGLKRQWVIPAGATIAGTFTTLVNTATTIADSLVAAYTSSGVAGCGTVGAGTPVGLIEEAILTTAGTPGTCQLQWAQNVSSATALRVFAGSKLILQRVG